jgi:rhodanese-related sulfurtransferase
VQDLQKKNITNAAALLGGYEAWKSATLPVEPAAK